MLRDRRALTIGALAVITAAIWIRVLIAQPRPLTVTFLDVGDGLCAVMRSPSGKTMVVDCGTSSWRKPETVGERLTASYLRKMGVNAIDVAVLSHMHSDHVSGFAGLLRTIPASLVVDTAAEHPSPVYRRFLSATRSCGATYRRGYRGQAIDLGDGVVAEILHPKRGAAYGDLNNQSMALRITYGATAVLLAGDTGEEAECEMVDCGMELRAQVLQVGHHGSADATSPKWIGAVRPSVAIVSCSRSSRYGFPSKDVVRRLESAGARVYVTGRDGAVTTYSDGATITCRPFKAAR